MLSASVDYGFKIAVVGEDEIGKSKLVGQFVNSSKS